MDNLQPNADKPVTDHQQPEQQKQQQDQQHQQQPDDKQQGQSNHSKQLEQSQSEQQLQQQAALVDKLGTCILLHSSSTSRVWECASFCGRPCLVKHCLQQTQRHPLLARKLAQNGAKQDVAGMCRARKIGVRTPTPYHTDLQQQCVVMERVPGSPLQQLIDAADTAEADVEHLLSSLGQLLAVLHDGGVVHGQLSSGNVLVREGDQALVLLNFECSFNSMSPQDKAADLAVLEAQLQSLHESKPGLFDKVLAAYNKKSKNWSATFNRLNDARNKGQKRQKTK